MDEMIRRELVRQKEQRVAELNQRLMKCPRDDKHEGIDIIALDGFGPHHAKAICAVKDCGAWIKWLSRSDMRKMEESEGSWAALERVKRLVAACRNRDIGYLERMKTFREFRVSRVAIGYLDEVLEDIADMIQEAIEQD